MKSEFRCLLLCLLLAALPLQGWAAISMSLAGSCGNAARHDAHDGLAMHMQQDEAHAVPMMRPAMQKAHDAGSASSARHDNGQGDGQGSAHKLHDFCAACFAFSLPVSLTLTFAPVAPVPLPPFVAVFIGHQPDSLERPPKSTLV